MKIDVLKRKKNFGISEGPQWPQGLHGVVAQNGTMCFVLSSLSLDIHHTPKDTFDLLSLPKIKNCAELVHNILKIIEAFHYTSVK